jgi:hypothetical protein
MGLTAEAAAREVGCPPKTLGTRLRRGRARLAVRLARRGVALPAGALALELSRCAATAAPTRLALPAVQAALGFTSASAAAVSPAVVALTEGVTNVMLLKSPKCVALLACAVLAVAGLTHHAAFPGKAGPAPAARAVSEAAPAPRREAPKAGFLEHMHRFLVAHLHAVIHFAHGTLEAAVRAEEGAKDKEKASLSGVWMRKDAELKLDFADKGVLKIYPHGENEVIVFSCEYSLGKDGRVQVKITGVEGKEDAKEKVKERVPLGTEFSFRWKARGAAATLSDLKGDKADTLKSHLEGDYAEKK